MIGVICASREEPVVREFFQLFKTPWSLFEPTGSYDAVLISGSEPIPEKVAARLVIRFGDQRHARTRPGAEGQESLLVSFSNLKTSLPIFCGVGRAASQGRELGWLAESRTPVACEDERGGRCFISCGYNLFAEVGFLLGQGQPAEHAGTPTLELHIELLRHWMLTTGVEVVELHPTPPNCGLLAALTHDVDFVGIRRHTSDKTLLGFLYRASLGSLIDLVRGRGSLRRLFRNWGAILSLPLVHLGLIEDFWLPFKRYDKADSPWRSTFFIVPFRGRPGQAPGGGEATGRGVAYGASEIAPQLRELAERGHEIALHGIDAWCDPDLARQESAAIRAASGSPVVGVRMHWLYYDGASPLKLEAAGLAYDASLGYNETVGFRAGTAQVFAPPGTEHLLELPLLIQDTSLLYPARMHCRESEAVAIAERLLNTVCEVGGAATISWHERSLSPERLWDQVYAELRNHLHATRAAVRPAHQVVDWFRTRRGVDLEGAELSPESITEIALEDTIPIDALRVRIHHPTSALSDAGPAHTDLAVRAEDLVAVLRHPQALVSAS